MRMIVMPVLAAMMLSGCGVYQSIENQRAAEKYQQSVAEHKAAYKRAGEEARAAAEECMNKRLRGELKGFVASVKCSNPRMLAAWRESGYPFMDLIEQEMAQRLMLAEKVDSGEITEGDFQVQITAFVSHMHDVVAERVRAMHEERRNAAMANAAVNAANSAASAAQMNAFTGMAAVGTQMLQPPSPGLTCTTFGNTTSCR